jgi:hypothetical protein
VRADINIGHDGRPKGSGIVVFATPEDAQNAINMYNGFDWNGRPIEVREDRFASGAHGGFQGGPQGGFAAHPGFQGGYGGGFQGGYGGGFGGPRGGFQGGFGGPRGGFRGGFGGGFGAPRGGFQGGYGGHGGFQGAVALPPAEPSQQIFVKNVSVARARISAASADHTRAAAAVVDVERGPGGALPDDGQGRRGRDSL